MKVNPIGYFNCYKNNYSKNYIKQNQENKIKNLNLSVYPKNYYVSFSAITPKKLIEIINEDDFPSKEIYSKVKNAYKNDRNFSLYNAHIEHYQALLDLKTLDEAKELYPEFKDVTDAKDLTGPKIPYTIRHIAQGKKDVKIEDFTLELLKRYFAQAISIAGHKDEYFGITQRGLNNIFQTLNIPFYKQSYSKILYRQEPEFLSVISQKAAEYAKNHPEIRQARSEYLKEHPIVNNREFDDEERKHMSEIRKEYNINHPEVAKRHAQHMKQLYQQKPELKKQISESLLEFNGEHPEYGILHSYVYKKIFPDYCYSQSQIAKEYQGIGTIIIKKNKKINLTAPEKDYLKMYYAACMRQFPGINKKIGEIYSELFDFFNLSKDCNSDEKINEIEAFFNDEEKVKELMLKYRGFVVE